jgi:hypothetical protein
MVWTQQKGSMKYCTPTVTYTAMAREVEVISDNSEEDNICALTCVLPPHKKKHRAPALANTTITITNNNNNNYYYYLNMFPITRN